ncbi:SCO family protein [Limnoglobus roseus]|uniref:SCO family protein n=1 Tax=Limnoglobus roseus TaxID=2598579 RepID=A0A5C1AB53_9BACT|nr:SCO family protein [Limnoglobus roseus]QEL15403.1 SCO family protein [Limnoglobus roseus]
MPKLRLILIVLLSLSASVGGAFLAQSLRSKKPTPPADDTELPTVPAFHLTERSGKSVTNADLTGKVWIASFVFTRCSGTCPAVAATLARLQAELADVPDVRLVTFTIDPDRDTPEELKKYAERYRADPNRWLFLTGPEKEIHALANEGFMMLAKKRPDGKPGDEFDHSTFIVLVDKAGRIHGHFDGIPPQRSTDTEAYEASVKRLKDRVRELAKD